MIDSSKVNIEMFNDDNLIVNLDGEHLVELALLAVNAMQLNKVAHAKNINYKVVTAILSNVKVEMYELDAQSFLNLVKFSRSNQELCKIMEGVNAKLR